MLVATARTNNSRTLIESESLSVSSWLEKASQSIFPPTAASSANAIQWSKSVM